MGARTACPVLIDNLSEEEVDAIWGEISKINWNLREVGDPMVASQISNKHLQNSKRRSRSNVEGKRLSIAIMPTPKRPTAAGGHPIRCCSEAEIASTLREKTGSLISKDYSVKPERAKMRGDNVR